MCWRHSGCWNSNSTQAQTEPPATHEIFTYGVRFEFCDGTLQDHDIGCLT